MDARTPTLLVPGLNCTSRVFAGQVQALWAFGPVMIADHTRGDTVDAIAAAILAAAPPRFDLVGFSLGGYVALAIMRQAAERVVRLALVDTSARPDTPEQSERRRRQIAIAREGRFETVVRDQFPVVVHPAHAADMELLAVHTAMALECGAEVFARHQQAIIARPDARSGLAAIRCPTLVVVGDSDRVTPPEAAEEIAAGIAGATLVTIREAGHLTPLEQPDALAQALAEFRARPLS